jgi:hypothetical protein
MMEVGARLQKSHRSYSWKKFKCNYKAVEIQHMEYTRV